MIDEIAVLPIVASIPAFILIGYTIVDVVRRQDLTPPRKGLWIGVVLVLPVVGVLIYLVARPLADPAKAPTEGNSRTAEFVRLLADREQGRVPDDEFTSAKRRLFAEAPDSDLLRTREEGDVT